ncbi:hypothetical protein FJ955_01995 [Mesorhizobium sp. B2-2-2]|uniref:hypothetical protein n=1 Tax=Mesorhizobium sp. B2-2-2 TaxID=2589964 RepID=UPI001128D504|nr:hypothetical protein [Mesorhizobium sp. B2-2-2]TPM33543.1 hypothetical protein FJ955_01995 [Mesorhizobium sp. B2-2-2]
MTETKKKWISNVQAGRPPKSHFGAMTSAERQRQYRQRLKEQGRRPKVGKLSSPASAEVLTGVAAEKSIRLTRLAVSVIELLHVIESLQVYDGEPLSPEKAGALREAAARVGCLAMPGADEAVFRKLGGPWGVAQVEHVRKKLAEKEKRFAAGKL